MVTASGLPHDRHCRLFHHLRNYQREDFIEATSEQRQRLLEAIFRRNAVRRRFGLPPLDTKRAYENGLNKLVMANVRANRLRDQAKEQDDTLLFHDGDTGLQSNIVHFDVFHG